MIAAGPAVIEALNAPNSQPEPMMEPMLAKRSPTTPTCRLSPGSSELRELPEGLSETDVIPLTLGTGVVGGATRTGGDPLLERAPASHVVHRDPGVRRARPLRRVDVSQRRVQGAAGRAVERLLAGHRAAAEVVGLDGQAGRLARPRRRLEGLPGDPGDRVGAGHGVAVAHHGDG